jgi:hypothetical protein
MTTKPKRFTYGFAPVPAQPTARNVETALCFLDAHRRVSDSDPVCRWCGQHWPCPTAQWSQRVLKRSAKNIQAHGTAEPDSPAQPP